MDKSTAFTDFLRSLKNRRFKDLPTQKSLIKSKRLEKRDQLRATMRTFSPLPPTPSRPTASKDNLKSSNKSVGSTIKSNQSTKSTNKKVVKMLENDLKADTTTKAEQQRAAALERLQRAKKWRELKQKQLAEKKANERPPFIVSRYVQLQPVPTFERPLTKENHKFKPPVNIKPINFETNSKKVANARPGRHVLNIKDTKGSTKSTANSTAKQSTAQRNQAPTEYQRVTRGLSRKLFTQSYDPGIQQDISNNETTERPENKDNEKTKTPKTIKMKKTRSGTPGKALREKVLNFSDDFESNSEDTTQKSEEVTTKSGKTPKRKSRTTKIQKNIDSPDVFQGNEENSDEVLSVPPTEIVNEVKNTDKPLKRGNKTPKSAKTPKRKSRVSAIPQNGDLFNEMEANKENQEQDDDDGQQLNVVTPENKPDVAIMYVSPFVTMSRGKRSARAEFAERSARGGELLSSPEATGTKAGSAYFCKLMDDEIARIRMLCAYWEDYKLNNTDLPEEAENIINVPIGQSNLLISKKMKQFRALIDKSIHSDDNLSVTCADLHGFWDTVMIQVYNLNLRFENLDKLRDNNWEEVIPPKQESPIIKKRILPKRKAAKATAGTKQGGKAPVSKLRQAIAEAKARQMKETGVSATSILMERTSILKIATPKSAAKKAVVFKEDVAEVINEKVASYTPRRSSRRSLRLSSKSEV